MGKLGVNLYLLVKMIVSQNQQQSKLLTHRMQATVAVMWQIQQPPPKRQARYPLLELVLTTSYSF